MAGRWYLDREKIMTLLNAAEEDALNVAASVCVEKAKAKAPVRKIYKEDKRRKTRAASPALIAAAIRHIQNNKSLTSKQRWLAEYIQRHPSEARVLVRRRKTNNQIQQRHPLVLGHFRDVHVSKSYAKGIGGSKTVFRSRVGAVPANRRGFRNRRFQKGFEITNARLDARLSARGRYEIRSGRATVNEMGRVQVGGRLKKSIAESEIKRDGTRVSIRVSASVPYAKFVEFPTRHNAAQPFMLPALKETGKLLVPIAEHQMRIAGLKRG